MGGPPPETGGVAPPKQSSGMRRSAGAAILSLGQRASIPVGFLEAAVEEIVLPFPTGLQTPTPKCLETPGLREDRYFGRAPGPHTFLQRADGVAPIGGWA